VSVEPDTFCWKLLSVEVEEVLGILVAAGLQ